MTRTLAAILAALLIAPATALAENAIDGTWKMDIHSVHAPTKPEVMVLQDGMFACASCIPPYKVKADGSIQPISGSPYRDHVSVKVLGSRSVEQVFYKDGRKVGDGTAVVSPDGRTLTVTFTDSSDSSGAPVVGKVMETRVAAGPAGSAPISGAWGLGKIGAMSDNDLLITFKTKADVLSMTMPTGQSYFAKLDGTEAPYEGDPGVTSVSVKKIGPRAYEETDKRNGKVISVGTMTVSADGKALALVSHDKLAGTTSSIAAVKQ